MLRSALSRSGAAILVAALSFAAVSVPSAATAADGGDAPDAAYYAAFASTPAGAGAVPSEAVVTLAASSGGDTSLRAVASGATTVVQRVDETTGAVVESLDVSGRIDVVRDASSVRDYGGSAPYPENVYLLGRADGEETLVRIVAPSSLADSGTTVEGFDTDEFAARSGIALSDLVLLRPFSTGLLAVAADGDGYRATRLHYDLTPQTGRTPLELPFSGERTFTLDDYGDLYASRAGGIDRVSMYDLGRVVSVDAPSLGLVRLWVAQPYQQLAVADADGTLATVNLAGGGFEPVFTVELGDPAASLAVVSQIGEVQVATAGAASIRRFAVSDGAERTPIGAPGAVLAGSLRAHSSYAPSVTYLADVDHAVYAYKTGYVSSPKAYSTFSLEAADRVSGVDFSYGAAGTDLDLDRAWYEYSLDGGEHWAKRDQSWSEAVPDRGSLVTPPGTLPAPMDGVAPHLRQVTDEDLWASVTIGSFEAAVSLTPAQYDALWRYRVESDYGSVASASTRIVVTSEQEVDPTLRVTQHPASARVSVGEAVTFSAAGQAETGPTLQWQRSADGENWSDIDGENASELRLVASATDAGSRYRAILRSGSSEIATESAALEVMSPAAPISAAAPVGAVTASGAALSFDLSTYSHEWLRSVAGSHVALSDTGFSFGDGTGWVDDVSGQAQLSWEGTAVYRPYGGYLGLYLAFANPHLAVAADGRATLTAEVAWNDGAGHWSGAVDRAYRRVIVATFAASELAADGGTVRFAGTPEWQGRAYSAGAGEVRADSFPSSFVDYLDPSNQGWFLATGSARDAEKAPLPIAATATLSDDPAATTGTVVDALDPLGDGRDPFTPSTPALTAHPQPVTIAVGSTTVLTAAASGWPRPQVQWQELIQGQWVDIDGATGAQLSVSGEQEGERAFRAVFSGQGVSVVTDAAIVTVIPASGGPDPVAAPALTASPAAGLRDGGSVEVSGSDFVRHTNRSGVYLLFGYARVLPSQGGVLGRDFDYLAGTDSQRFIAWPEASTAGAAQAVFTDDGRFTVSDFTVRSGFVGASGRAVDCRAEGVQCGVFTIGAHGATDGAVETFAPIAFAPDTTEPGTDPGTDPGTEPGADPGAEPGTDPDAGGLEPSETDLVDALEGAVRAPANAVAGSSILVSVGADRAGETVSAFLFSTPTGLGSRVVGADGTFTLQLPEGIVGQHRLAVYGADGAVIGWVTISIAPASTAVEAAHANADLAATGAVVSPATPMLGAGILLLGIVLVTRRRRSSARS